MHNGIVKMVLLAEIDQLSNRRISVFCFQFSVFRFSDFLVSNSYSGHLLSNR